MKKVYYQVVDPVNKTSITGDKEYNSNSNEIVLETLLRELHLNKDDYAEYVPVTKPYDAVPNMPDYYMSHGYIDGTSKLITIIIISK